MLKRTLLCCSILCFLNTASLYADTCDSSRYACATIAINGNIAPDVPIVYSDAGGWGHWTAGGGNNITIPTFVFPIAGPPPAPEIYPITFGTLNASPMSIIYINTSSQYSANGNYVLQNTSDSNASIAYQVTYTGCNNHTQSITPPNLPVTLPYSEIEMAGANPACHPQDQRLGAGAGYLTFSLIAPPSDTGASAFIAGSYTGQLHVVVCTQAPCTN